MKYVYPAALLGAIIVVGTVAAFMYAPAASPATTPSVPVPATTTPTDVTTTGTPPPVPSGYTLAQVAMHAGSASCWTAINGNVYDLTDWISQHPGGEGPILSICGTDGTQAFSAQHGNQRQPNQILASFKIGALIP